MKAYKQKDSAMALVQTPPVFAELIDFLASSPSQEEILAYKNLLKNCKHV
jgi:hypothetical protein